MKDIVSRLSGGSKVLFVQSSVRWDFLWQRHHSLAAAAAKDGWLVVFMEPGPRSLLQIIRYLKRRGPGNTSTLKNPVPDGVIVLKWRPFRSRWRLMRVARASAEVALIGYLPTLPLLMRTRRADWAIYDRVLAWDAVPKNWYPPLGWRAVEAAINRLSRARRVSVVTDSQSFAREWHRRGGFVRLILPAVDEAFARYRWQPAPMDGPIGYFGTVRSGEIDIDHLCVLARKRDLVVRGEVPPHLAAQLAQCGARILPPLPPDALVSEVDKWAAIVLPYLRGPRTDTLVPAKLWNAVATNRPVYVSGLDLPDELRRFALDDVAGSDSALRCDEPLALAGWADRWAQIRDLGRKL